MDIHLYGHPVKALLIFQLSQLLIQLPANDPRKAAEGGQSILDPAMWKTQKRSAWLLALPWSSPDHSDHLGNKLADEIYLYFLQFLSASFPLILQL